MKAIKYVLVSYTQMEYIHLFNFVLGILYFIVGNIKYFKGDGFHDDFFSTWHFFLIGLLMITPQLMMQTKRLIRFNAGLLMPDKMSSLFLASGIIFLPFLVMPVIYVIYLGLPVLPHIAMLMIIPSSLLLGSDLFLSDMKTRNITGKSDIIFALGIIFLSYVLLGFPLGEKLESKWSVLIQFCRQHDLSMYVLGLSLVFVLISVRFFSKYSQGDNKGSGDGDSSFMYRLNYDKASSVTLNYVNRKLAKLLKKIKSGSISHTRQIGLFQYSLFNPGSSIIIHSLIIQIIAVNLVVFVASGIMTERVYEVLFYILPPSVIWLSCYYIDASMLSLEFLLHRNRLTMLRNQSQHETRSSFARTVFLSYLFIAGKRFIVVTIALLTVRFIFSDFFYINIPSIPVVLAAGILMYLFMIALSLFFSEDIRSANCIGWNISTIISAFAIWILLFEYWHYSPEIFLSWILILCSGVIAVLFLWHALKSLADSELDFVSPEQLT